ncbi:MAG: ATP synthase F0 subunit B [Myxococcota bacterium]|nr:ATP synthase F0 subunit B [Myxococcota bacterium]
MNILDQLGIDPTMVGLQMIPFLIVVGGLYLIIFKPMLAMLAEREKNISGFRHSAELMQEEVSAKLTELEEKLSQARVEAKAERAKLRQEAIAAEQELLKAARSRTDEMLTAARKEIEAERETAQAQLQSSATELSLRIAGTVLGRQVGESN